MGYLSIIFLFVLSINAAAQSSAVETLFSEGTQHASSERFDDAIKQYKSALALAENEYLSNDYRARLQYNIGVCYFRLDRFDEAAGRFKQAILLDHGYTAAHHALGQVRNRKRGALISKAN